MLDGLPTPARDADSEPFWQGCDEGRLRLQRCLACSAFRWPPGPVCPPCGSRQTQWVDSAGHGQVYSWVVVQVALTPVLSDQLPYAVGLVMLDEGVRMVSTIEGCDMTEITLGMSVLARFDTSRDGGRMLAFAADRQGGA